MAGIWQQDVQALHSLEDDKYGDENEKNPICEPRQGFDASITTNAIHVRVKMHAR